MYSTLIYHISYLSSASFYIQFIIKKNISSLVLTNSQHFKNFFAYYSFNMEKINITERTTNGKRWKEHCADSIPGKAPIVLQKV